MATLEAWLARFALWQSQQHAGRLPVMVGDQTMSATELFWVGFVLALIPIVALFGGLGVMAAVILWREFGASTKRRDIVEAAVYGLILLGLAGCAVLLLAVALGARPA